jgi:hypothetical protein
MLHQYFINFRNKTIDERGVKIHCCAVGFKGLDQLVDSGKSDRWNFNVGDSSSAFVLS